MIDLNKEKYTKLFLILSFFSCWLSISTSTLDIYKIFNLYKANLIETNSSVLPAFSDLVNFLRQLIMFIIFPILLILNFFKIDIKKTRYDFPFLCFFLYFIFQIPGLILTENSYLNIGFIISAINVFLILNLSISLFDKKTFRIFIYLNLFFLLLITLLNKDVYVRFFLSSDGTILYNYLVPSSDIFLDKASPRSTGSARTILLIYLISILLFKKFFNKNKNLKYVFYVITALLILLFQSRTVVVLLIVFLIFNFFYDEEKKLLKYLISHFLIPIILLYGLIYVKNYTIISTYEEDGVNILQSINQNFNRPIDPSTYSSGRVNDWKEIINKTKTSMIYGYGSQGDRFLINQTASNGLLYAYSSSGLFGIIFYIIFVFSCLLKIFNISIKKHKQSSLENNLSCTIIFIIILRSILESSFAVFSVDFIIIISFYSYVLKENLQSKYAN